MSWRFLRTTVARMSFGVVLAASALGNAAPAPLTEEKLHDGSDLIIEADVLCVAKLGRPDAPAWYARLVVRKVLKGGVPSNPMPYWFLPAERGVLGDRDESVYAGERVRMFLIRDKDGNYVAWAQNSIEPLEDFPAERRVLPTRFGEVIESSRRACGQ
jgi:hypothetical protein